MESDADEVIEIERLVRPTLDASAVAGSFHLPLCGPPKLLLTLSDAMHSYPGRGVGVRSPRVRLEAALTDGLVLRCEAHGLGDVVPFPNASGKVELDVTNWVIARTDRRLARSVQMEVHGWPARESVPVAGRVGPLQVVFRGPAATCPQAGDVSMWLVSRLDGRPIGRRAAWKTARRLVDLARLGLNRPLSVPQLHGLDAQGRPVWSLEGPIAPHPKSMARELVLATSTLGALRQVPVLMAEAWDSWDDAVAKYRVDVAVEYVSRASTGAYMDHQARDLVVALEAMVKAFCHGRTGKLEPLLKGFQEAVGLAGSAKERESFVRWRNQLAHEGVVASPTRPVAPGKQFQSVGWLRSFVLRHLLVAVGWTGDVIDFGASPWKARGVRSARFRRPMHVP